ncbi:putative fungal-specific transcription factor [Tuber indicum]|nr:putative fungal-specific transcription factor [Tuber indicum]
MQQSKSSRSMPSSTSSCSPPYLEALPILHHPSLALGTTPIISTFGGEDGGDHKSSSNTNAKTKRKRSMIACKNCNERRVRCDASTIGLPCSNCQHSGKGECQFIESKRVRGARGRFERQDGKSEESVSPKVVDFSPARPELAAAKRGRRHSISGIDGEEWQQLQQNAASNRSNGTMTYLGESWHLAWAMGSDAKTAPLHRPHLYLGDEKDINHRLNKELWERGAYMLPRSEVRDRLIVEYFRIFHPCYPILDKRKFLHSIKTNTFSHILMQSVLTVAATHCDLSILQNAGYIRRHEAVEIFYKRARSLFDGDVEPDKMINMQSMFLLQFWWRAPSDQRDTLWWLGGAIRLAQTMGLHRNPKNSPMSIDIRRIWKRAWWCLYIRDRQCSSSLGKPVMIRNEDCDVEDLTPDDFADDDHGTPPEHIIYIMQQASLCKILGDMLLFEYCPGASKNITEKPEVVRDLARRLEEWKSVIPRELEYNQGSRNLWAIKLQLSYRNAFVLYHRPLCSNLNGHHKRLYEGRLTVAAIVVGKAVKDLLEGFGARFMCSHDMACFFCSMTIHLVDSRTPNTTLAKEADGRFQVSLVQIREMEKILPVARWFRDRLKHAIQAREEAIAAEAERKPNPQKLQEHQQQQRQPQTRNQPSILPPPPTQVPSQPQMETPLPAPSASPHILTSTTITEAQHQQSQLCSPDLQSKRFRPHYAPDRATMSSAVPMGPMQETEEVTSVMVDTWASHNCSFVGLGGALNPQSGMLGMGGGGGLGEHAVGESDYQWVWDSVGGSGSPYVQMRFEAE